jgi:hypothetical protein
LPGIRIKISTEEASVATKKLRADLEKLGATSKMTEAQIKSLETRMLQKMGADKSRIAMDSLSKSVGMSKVEIEKFNKSLGLQSTIIDSGTMSTMKMIAGFVGITSAMMAFQAAMGFVHTAMKKGFNAVEEYAVSTASLAAMVMTFSEKQKGMDLASQWKASLQYAQTMIPVLENLAAKTLLSGQETTALANAFARSGVFLDATNEKQILAFTRISNALPLLTQGQAIMMQINQEIRGLLTGEREAGSMLLMTLKAVDPQIKEHLKTWREQNTVMENVGNLLSGFGPATDLLENSWQAVKSTIDTTATQILRGVMRPVYEDIIKSTKELNALLSKNKDLIINWSKEVYARMKMIGDIYKELKPFLTIFFGTPYLPEKEWASGIGRQPAPPPKAKINKEGLTKSELEQVDALKRELNMTIELGIASDQLTEKLISNRKKYADMRAKDTAGGLLLTIKKAEVVEEAKIWKEHNDKLLDDSLKAEETRTSKITEERKKINQTVTELDKDLTNANAGELQQRMLRIEEVAQKQKEIAYSAYQQDKDLKIYQKRIDQIEEASKIGLLEDFLKIEIERTSKITEERKRANQAVTELDKELTLSSSSELRKREIQIEEVAQKQKEIAYSAYQQDKDLEGYRKRTRQIEEIETKEKIKTNSVYYSQLEEMQINQRLAELDTLEKTGTAHRNTIEERISLENKLLASQKERLRITDPIKEKEAYLQLQIAMQQTIDKITGLTREQKMKIPVEAVKLSMDELINEWTDTGQQMYSLAKETANAMQGAFSDFFFDVMTGKLKSFGDYVTSFLNSVARSISNVLAQQAVAGIGNYAKSFFGQPASSGVSLTESSVSSGSLVVAQHSGGLYNEPSFYRYVSDAAFINAQRAHTGIGPREKPVIIRDDEGVFTKGQMAAMSPAKPQNIKVEIINESGQKMEIKNSETRFNPQEMVVTLWMDAANRNAYGLRTFLGG